MLYSQALPIAVIVGAVIGWLAVQLFRGTGLGLLADALIGIIGALIASVLLPSVGFRFGSGALPTIITATLGAAISLLIVRLIDGLLADAE